MQNPMRPKIVKGLSGGELICTFLGGLGPSIELRR